jgi:hypothetical protein
LQEGNPDILALALKLFIAIIESAFVAEATAANTEIS